MSRASGFAIMQPFRFGRDLRSLAATRLPGAGGESAGVEAFSPIGLGLAVLGCVFWRVRGRAAWIFRLWLAGAALVLILTPNLLPANHYYLAILLPAGAALAGMALAALTPNRKAYPLLAVVLIVFAAGAIYSALPLYEPDRLPYDPGTGTAAREPRPET